MDKKLKELYDKVRTEYYNGDKTVKWLRRTRPVIYTTVKHVSNSGMFRIIDVFAIRNNQKLSLNYLIELTTGYTRDKDRDGLRVSGCGMDMGFAVVYNFSRAIFPYGFKYKKTEWHRNNDPSPKDQDGGYALKQKWF